MFTNQVRMKLASDYGIRDIPLELLIWFVQRYHANERWKHDPATIAFLVANEWQRSN